MTNRIIVYLLAFIFCVNNAMKAQPTDGNKEQALLRVWKAGTTVSESAVRKYGEDKCFQVCAISNDVFKRIYGKSYKRNCTISRKDLRYLKVLHYTTDNEIRLGELVCNKRIAADLIDILHKLFKARYPIEKMLLIDDFNADDETSMRANNTSCFNYRVMTGSKHLSKHATGCAIDINTLYNPYVRHKRDGSVQISPANGVPYANRKKNFHYKINRHDLCYNLFISHGFAWGGDWKHTKDYQHFEKK